MYVNPGTSVRDLGQELSHDGAERVSKDWWKLLINGLLMIVAGILIFSIKWSVGSLATFLGAVFIVEGIALMTTSGFDDRVKKSNVITGLLSIFAGILIIAWPSPGLVVLGVVLGSWLIVLGTITIAGAIELKPYVKEWWLFLLEGLLMIPLGVLALADPGDTLAALVTVGGIFAVAVGVTRVVLSFEIKRLPKEVDRAWTQPTTNGNGTHSTKTSASSTARAAS
jgi:uncharacterized membrane protein HdeD (DUF308 family)